MAQSFPSHAGPVFSRVKIARWQSASGAFSGHISTRLSAISNRTRVLSAIRSIVVIGGFSSPGCSFVGVFSVSVQLAEKKNSARREVERRIFMTVLSLRDEDGSSPTSRRSSFRELRETRSADAEVMN